MKYKFPLTFNCQKQTWSEKINLKQTNAVKLNFKIAVNSVLITFAQSVQWLLTAKVAHLKAHIEI